MSNVGYPLLSHGARQVLEGRVVRIEFVVREQELDVVVCQLVANVEDGTLIEAWEEALEG